MKKDLDLFWEGVCSFCEAVKEAPKYYEVYISTPSYRTHKNIDTHSIVITKDRVYSVDDFGYETNIILKSDYKYVEELPYEDWQVDGEISFAIKRCFMFRKKVCFEDFLDNKDELLDWQIAEEDFIN